jgi:hypothetical protein
MKDSAPSSRNRAAANKIRSANAADSPRGTESAPRSWEISELLNFCLRIEVWLAENPSGVDRAADLREFLRPPRVADVTYGFTRRIGERTVLAGRRLELLRLGLGLQTCVFSDRAAIGRRDCERTIRTCRSRRAAGMFGFGSARASSPIIPEN